MKENILEVVSTCGTQIRKKLYTLNMPQLKPSEKCDELLGKLGISWLPAYAKGFFINSKQVTILNEPKAFYNLILEKIKQANERIVLASLYLGTGLLEKNLVSVLNETLLGKPKLRVKLLLDCVRGSRGEDNSREMLLPLLKNHDDACQVSLYQTPFLRQPYLSVLPERYKEVIGLQHIKVYLFDNDLIISGANMSSDYFTNRQDRYILIKESKELADFIDGFVGKVSECSFQLNSKNELNLHPNWTIHPTKSKPEAFISEARSRLNQYYNEFACNNEDECDTVIFPLIEMGPFNIHMDSTVTTKLIEDSGKGMNMYLTTGYFNLTDFYTHSIINKSKANIEILMAHPTSNGFFNARGPAKGIPHAYTDLARQFLEKVLAAEQSSRINMYEYIRPGWTYHAKGLWLSSADKDLPFLTMVGSPNFGERSVKRDLECQFLLATSSESLQESLLREREMLYSTCTSKDNAKLSIGSSTQKMGGARCCSRENYLCEMSDEGLETGKSNFTLTGHVIRAKASQPGCIH